MDRDELLKQAAQLENLGVDLGRIDARSVPLRVASSQLVRLASVLSSPNVHPVLVGEHGVGKTSLVTQLARTIDGREPWPQGAWLAGHRVIQVSAAQLLADALYSNQMEHKVQLIAAACREAKTVLFLDDLHTMIGTGSWSGDPEGGVLTHLTTFIERGDIRVIAATTPQGWASVLRRNPRLARALLPLSIEPCSREEALEILTHRAPAWGAQHGVTLTDEALEEALDLSDRLFPWKRLPGKACALVEAALTLHRAEDLEQRFGLRPGASEPRKPFDRRRIAESVQQLTGLPEFLLVPSVPAPRVLLEHQLKQRLVGQDHLVDQIVERIQMIKAGVCSSGRPLAAYILAGPTGVGKTLLARTLAEVLLGDEDRISRFDMSEFSTADSVDSFVSARDERRTGYGLVDVALSHPMPVILLDEIEKAHARVFDLLLQVLGDGRLTDAIGRTAHFTNAIVLMTSNLGSGASRIRYPATGSSPDARVSQARSAIHQHFRPEFVNRVTDVLVFEPLDHQRVTEIARREVDALAARQGLRARRLRVEVHPAALAEIVSQGFSPEFGARPMARAVDRLAGGALGRVLGEQPELSDQLLVLRPCGAGRLTAVPLPAHHSPRQGSASAGVRP